MPLYRTFPGFSRSALELFVIGSGVSAVSCGEAADGRAGSVVSGFVQTTRVNEPGRTLWVKLDFSR